MEESPASSKQCTIPWPLAAEPAPSASSRLSFPPCTTNGSRTPLRAEPFHNPVWEALEKKCVGGEEAVLQPTPECLADSVVGMRWSPPSPAASKGAVGCEGQNMGGEEAGSALRGPSSNDWAAPRTPCRPEPLAARLLGRAAGPGR